MNTASLVASGGFHHQPGWGSGAAHTHTKNSNTVKATQNFLKLKTDHWVAEKKELEKRPDVFLTCNYKLSRPHELKRVRAVIHKTRAVRGFFSFLTFSLDERNPKWFCPAETGFACPLHRQEHRHKVTASAELCLGVLWSDRKKQANRLQHFATFLIRAWMQTGSTEAITQVSYNSI